MACARTECVLHLVTANLAGVHTYEIPRQSMQLFFLKKMVKLLFSRAPCAQTMKQDVRSQRENNGPQLIARGHCAYAGIDHVQQQWTARLRDSGYRNRATNIFTPRFPLPSTLTIETTPNTGCKCVILCKGMCNNLPHCAKVQLVQHVLKLLAALENTFPSPSLLVPLPMINKGCKNKLPGFFRVEHSVKVHDHSYQGALEKRLSK